jgi:hypothetical protein
VLISTPTHRSEDDSDDSDIDLPHVKRAREIK